MVMKVLVIGGGGREHAIVDALSRSPQVEKIYCAPGNAGIALQAECVAIKDTDVERLRDFAVEKGIDLTVVGPEAALAAGVTDVGCDGCVPRGGIIRIRADEERYAYREQQGLCQGAHAQVQHPDGGFPYV